jgi:hypothetical protein
MEINPLKVRNSDNTIKKPIKTIYVPNAFCKKIGGQVYNQYEIDRIVMLIGEIMLIAALFAAGMANNEE